MLTSVWGILPCLIDETNKNHILDLTHISPTRQVNLTYFDFWIKPRVRYMYMLQTFHDFFLLSTLFLPQLTRVLPIHVVQERVLHMTVM